MSATRLLTPSSPPLTFSASRTPTVLHMLGQGKEGGQAAFPSAG